MSELRLNTITDKDTDKGVNVDALHYQNTQLVRNLGPWQPGLVFENKTDYATYNDQAIVARDGTTLPYTTQGSDPTVAPDVGNVVPFAEVTRSDLVTVREDLLGPGTQLYMGDDGESVKVGDTVPAGTTHLRYNGDLLAIWGGASASGVVDSIVANDFTGYNVTLSGVTYEFVDLNILRDRRKGIASAWSLGSSYPSDESHKMSKALHESRGRLHFRGEKLFLGEVPAGGYKFLVDGDGGFSLTGTASITANAQAQSEAVGPAALIVVKNPVGAYTSSGIYFNDPSWDLDSAVGGATFRYGWYAVAVYATDPYTSANPVTGVDLNHSATNVLGHTYGIGLNTQQDLGVPGTVVKRGIKGIEVRGVCDTVYYGFTNIYACDSIKANLICRNVRRGFSSYGTRDFDVNIPLHCTAGFPGSNAFVNLACEGGEDDVYNGRVRVRVSGVESHVGYVVFYHQGDNAAGSISSIDSKVSFSEFTVTGKKPELGDTNVYTFVHETVNGIQTSTDRRLSSVYLDITSDDDSDEFSGKAFKQKSVPNSRGLVSLGSGISNYPLDDSIFYNYKIKAQGYSKSFSPVVLGEVTGGSCTYNEQKGHITVNGNLATVNIKVDFSGHTGSGRMRIYGIPFPLATDGEISNAPLSVIATGFPDAVNAYGFLAGDRTVIYMGSLVPSSGQAQTLELPDSGVFLLSLTAKIQ